MANGSGPRPTDDLANERTFLAYVRTSLSVMAFGFVIARFAVYLQLMPNPAHIILPQGRTSEILGIAFAVFGCLLGVVGMWRYSAAARALAAGRYRSNPAWPIAVGVATLLLGIAVVAGLLRFF